MIVEKQWYMMAGSLNEAWEVQPESGIALMMFLFSSRKCVLNSIQFPRLTWSITSYLVQLGEKSLCDKVLTISGNFRVYNILGH